MWCACVFVLRCEQLLGVNGKLRQELMLIGEPIPELQERLGQLLQVLIQRYHSHIVVYSDFYFFFYYWSVKESKPLKLINSFSKCNINQLFSSSFLQQKARFLTGLVVCCSSLVVEKQPPQVIKTQSKFSTTVRYLLGEKVAPGKPVVLKAQIINELQARNLGSVPGWVILFPLHNMEECKLSGRIN